MSPQAISVTALGPRRPHSASIGSISASAQSSSTPTSMSTSSSSSSYTLQTPQSPSILAVLDIGNREKAGSYSNVGIDDSEELFEDTLEARDLKEWDNHALLPAMLTSPPTVGSHQEATVHTPIRQGSFDSSASIQRQPNTTHNALWTDSYSRVSEGMGKPPSTAQNGLPVKRSVPGSPISRGSSDQVSSTDASQGRRMRPRLRAILSAPLANSRQSSNTTIAKIAGAMISRKTRESESELSTSASHDGEETLFQRRADSSKSTPSPTISDLVQQSPPPIFRRGLTLPTPAPPQLSEMVAVQVPPPRLDHFDRMLPKELKVMIMTRLLESGSEQERDRRWSGEVGARRELIKLSRVCLLFAWRIGLMRKVSKAWRGLCFDGQLWANFDLSPFAGYLHPGTLRTILTHSAPFIKNLSLRGLDALTSSELFSSLSILGSDGTSPPVFSKLTHIDLRGCRTLDSIAIIAMVTNARQLREINLKGVQAVNRNVLQCLASVAQSLESLDISRCRGIKVEDMCNFIKGLDKDTATQLKVLRFAGLRISTDPMTSAALFSLIFERLPNLKVLDLQGCSSISSNDLINACDELRKEGRTSPIQHLILSNCILLRAEIFPAMTGLFPELRILELASVPRMFEGNSRQDRIAFNVFLQSLPLLERLDLEDTCGAGGFDDSTLKILAKLPLLSHLKIGYAGRVSSEAMVQFIRDCPTLKVFEADVSALKARACTDL
jgi:hypothetical protein